MPSSARWPAASRRTRILSHDLLESVYARCGLVSDVKFYEEYPSRYDVDVDRRHRWIRGDWQIMPWLLPRVPAADGRAHPQSALRAYRGGRFSTTCGAVSFRSRCCFFCWGAGCSSRSSAVGNGARPRDHRAAGIVVARWSNRCASRSNCRGDASARNVGVIGRARSARSRSPWRSCPTMHSSVWTPSAGRCCACSSRGDDFWNGAPRAMWRATRANGSRRLLCDDVDRAGGRARRAEILLGVMQPARWPLALPFLGLWLAAPWIAWWISQPIEPPAPELERGAVDLPPPHRAQDLAFFRDLCHRGGELAAAGQFPGRACHRPWPRAPRRRTSGWRCSPIWRRAILVIFR